MSDVPTASIERALDRIGVHEMAVSRIDMGFFRIRDEAWLHMPHHHVDGEEWGLPGGGPCSIHWVGDGMTVLGRLGSLPDECGWSGFFDAFHRGEWFVTSLGQTITARDVQKLRRKASREATRNMRARRPPPPQRR